MASCSLPSSGDSKFELIRKILINFNTASGATADCLQPQSSDSEWDLWAKILQSIERL